MVGVTILILIDGFLQSNQLIVNPDGTVSHNPYFNRWFSAIGSADLSPFYRTVTILILIDGFLQYDTHKLYYRAQRVTILILIDGFLQFKPGVKIVTMQDVTILILIDGFLQ